MGVVGLSMNQHSVSGGALVTQLSALKFPYSLVFENTVEHLLPWIPWMFWSQEHCFSMYLTSTSQKMGYLKVFFLYKNTQISK